MPFQAGSDVAQGCRLLCGPMGGFQQKGEKSMTYQVNDAVFYNQHGVCRVADITDKQVGKTKIKYYVLKPVYDEASTFFVPAENPNLAARMRPILSEESVVSLIQKTPAEEPVWIHDEAQRKERCKEILSKGDQSELLRMIKALYAHQQEQSQKGKKLHMSDERFMKEAEKMLYEEFAFVLQIDRDQVLPFIVEQIEGANARPI